MFIHLSVDGHFKCILLIFLLSGFVFLSHGTLSLGGKAYCFYLAKTLLGFYHPSGGGRACSLDEKERRGGRLKILQLSGQPGIYYTRFRGHWAILRNPVFRQARNSAWLRLPLRTRKKEKHGAFGSGRVRPRNPPPPADFGAWQRSANQRRASVVLATVASKLETSGSLAKFGITVFWCPHASARARTHTHAFIHTLQRPPPTL